LFGFWAIKTTHLFSVFFQGRGGIPIENQPAQWKVDM